MARAVLDRLAVAGFEAVGRRGLLIRMNLGSDALPKRQLRAARTVEQSPTVIAAPLGNWSEVTIPMRLGVTAPPTLEQLPRWISGWKRDYSRISWIWAHWTNRSVAPWVATAMLLFSY